MVPGGDGAAVELDFEKAGKPAAAFVAEQGSAGIEAELTCDVGGREGPGGVDMAAAEEVGWEFSQPLSNTFLVFEPLDREFVFEAGRGLRQGSGRR